MLNQHFQLSCNFYRICFIGFLVRNCVKSLTKSGIISQDILADYLVETWVRDQTLENILAIFESFCHIASVGNKYTKFRISKIIKFDRTQIDKY